jgi:hypothetical protein
MKWQKNDEYALESNELGRLGVGLRQGLRHTYIELTFHEDVPFIIVAIFITLIVRCCVV